MGYSVLPFEAALPSPSASREQLGKLAAILGGKGTGPLQFDFSTGGFPGGWICFTVGEAPTLLVPEAGNDRVQVCEPVLRTCVLKLVRKMP